MILRRLLLGLANRVRRHWVAISFVLAIIVTVIPYSTTFDINAETEYLTVQSGNTTDPVGSSPWHFRGVEIFRNFSTEGEPFTGTLLLAENVRTEFERIAMGPLRIQCRVQPGKSVGVLTHENGTETVLGERVVFRVSQLADRAALGNSVVIPIVGDVTIGRVVAREVTADIPILRSGSIRLLGKSLLQDTIFEAGVFGLIAGDEISTPRRTSAARGLVMAHEAPSLSVAIRVVAADAVVSRFASSGYRVRTSLITRLARDVAIQGVWATFLGILGLRKLVLEESKR